MSTPISNQFCRSPALLKYAFNRLFISRSFFFPIRIIDYLAVPLFMSQIIGADALAVLAITAPLEIFLALIHSLFLKNSFIIVSRTRGEDNYRKANQAFTSLLLTGFLIYLSVYFLLVLLLPAILPFFTSDEKLLVLSLSYYTIYSLSFPIGYSLDFIEKIFSLDGRAFFFSCSKFFQTIGSVVFPYIFIVLMHLGIEGIGYAYIFKYIFSYGWSLSHFFCKSRTVFFDFSGCLHLKEIKSYLAESIKLGMPSAADYCIRIFVQSGINLIIGSIAGVNGFAVFSAINTFLLIIDGLEAVAAQFNSTMCSFLYGEHDFYGLKHVFLHALRWSLIISALLAVILCVFSNQFLNLFHFTDPEASRLFLEGVYPAAIFIFLSTIYDILNSYLIAIKKEQYSLLLSMLFPISRYLSIYVLKNYLGWHSIWYGYTVGLILTLLIFFYILLKKSSFFPKEQTENTSLLYSFSLNETNIISVIENIEEKLVESKPAVKAPLIISLILEELLTLIHNSQNHAKKDILTDLRIIPENNNVHISLSCTGSNIAPLKTLQTPELFQFNDINQRMLNEIATDITYDRVMYLNYIRLQPSRKENLIEMCFLLNEQGISFIEKEIEIQLVLKELPIKTTIFLTLLIEEVCTALYNLNKKDSKTAHACIRVRHDENNFYISLDDDGTEYKKEEISTPSQKTFNKKIIVNLADNCSYERVFDHNYLTLTVPKRN